MKKPQPKAPRRDSKLKNLPEHQRDLIAGWHLEDGEESCRSRILSELHISGDSPDKPVSTTTLYEALAFWRAEKRFSKFQNLAMAQAELESDAKGGMSAEEMHEAVDRNFIMLAAETEDTELYKELRMLRIADQSAKTKARQDDLKIEQKQKQIAQKDEEIWMAREKLLNDAATKLLDKALRAKADEINSSDLSNADKIAAMRQAAFAEIDELQRSGKVVIPK